MNIHFDFFSYSKWQWYWPKTLSKIRKSWYKLWIPKAFTYTTTMIYHVHMDSHAVNFLSFCLTNITLFTNIIVNSPSDRWNACICNVYIFTGRNEGGLGGGGGAKPPEAIDNYLYTLIFKAPLEQKAFSRSPPTHPPPSSSDQKNFRPPPLISPDPPSPPPSGHKGHK